jgi:hypothetical protein
MQRASSFRTESKYAVELVSRSAEVEAGRGQWGSLSNGGNERDSFTVNALHEG